MKGTFLRLVIVICIIFNMQIPVYAKSNNSDKPVYLPVLMYHKISEKSSAQGEYVVSPVEFENDLKLLRQITKNCRTSR